MDHAGESILVFAAAALAVEKAFEWGVVQRFGDGEEEAAEGESEPQGISQPKPLQGKKEYCFGVEYGANKYRCCTCLTGGTSEVFLNFCEQGRWGLGYCPLFRSRDLMCTDLVQRFQWKLACFIF